MLNQVCLVGVITKVEQGIDGKYYLWLEVERGFKEFDGTFKKDLIKCRIWYGAKDGINQYYHPNQRISIAGRIESDEEHNLSIVCYDIDYLGSKK